jgi:acetolactate synthase-1/2/3 large subunit
MKNFSGAEIVVKSLIDQGIKHIFGYPGGAILEIYDALNQMKEKIKHILVRHEQAATHMADGYSRSTGKTGVVLVTSGPGATNAITGIATAYMDSIPMIILSGQVESKLIGYDAFQECNMIGISQPIVKHSFLVQKTQDIPKIIQKSFLIASTGRPGPVVIDLPKDVLSAKKTYIFPKNVKIKSYNKKNKINSKIVKKILKKILQAKKPIIYIGGGIIHSESSEELKILTEKLNAPVTNSLMALGGFPGKHKQNLGMIGMHGKYEANMAMHHSDLIFALGVRFDDRTTNNTKKYCPFAKIIQVDIDPTSISKTIKADIKIIGDIKKVLKKIIYFLKKKKIKSSSKRLKKWWKKINKWRKFNFINKEKDSEEIKPQKVIKTLSKLTYGKFYITSDVGQHQMFTALHYLFEKPRQWINSGGLGTMGFGFPAALGVKIALPKKNVICITGDGSIQMNIQELSTAMQYKIPIMIINLNNSSLGMVKQWQDLIYSGRHSHSYMKSLPNFIKLVESYGHIGISISHPKELKKKLKKSLKYLYKKKLVFVDIKIDAFEHVYPMQIKGGGMNEMRFKK